MAPLRPIALVDINETEPPDFSVCDCRKKSKLSYDALFSNIRTKYRHLNYLFAIKFGGDDRARTGDLLLAKQMLSQLIYIPIWWITRESNPVQPVMSRLLDLRANDPYSTGFHGAPRWDTLEFHNDLIS